MAYVFALVPIGFGIAKLYRNYFSEKDTTFAQSDALRKRGVVDRLISGRSPPVMYLSEKQVEELIKTNSACRKHADEIREARRQYNQT